MNGVLMVLAAGALGALARFGVARLFPTPARPTRVPLAVLMVNVVGSFIAGLALGLGQTGHIPDGIAVVIVTGLCGGLTTFSTFSVETIQLFQQGSVAVAWRSIAANLVWGLFAGTVAYLFTLLVFW